MERGIQLHATNEGRETQQGFGGFEGTNALWLLAAISLALLFFRQTVESMGSLAAMGFASLPILAACAYVFGLKQGKPASYDVELFQWIIIKLSGSNYFSPSQTHPMKMPWVEDCSGKIPGAAKTSEKAE
jgi:hypothetical protein